MTGKRDEPETTKYRVSKLNDYKTKKPKSYQVEVGVEESKSESGSDQRTVVLSDSDSNDEDNTVNRLVNTEKQRVIDWLKLNLTSLTPSPHKKPETILNRLQEAGFPITETELLEILESGKGTIFSKHEGNWALKTPVRKSGTLGGKRTRRARNRTKRRVFRNQNSNKNKNPKNRSYKIYKKIKRPKTRKNVHKPSFTKKHIKLVRFSTSKTHKRR